MVEFLFFDTDDTPVRAPLRGRIYPGGISFAFHRAGRIYWISWRLISLAFKLIRVDPSATEGVLKLCFPSLVPTNDLSNHFEL
jgi:hypothetical protein